MPPSDEKSAKGSPAKKDKGSWELEAFGGGQVNILYNCSYQWSIDFDQGISIQQVPLPAGTKGALFVASGDGSIKGIAASADVVTHGLKFAASGAGDPKSWKLTVADGISICQNPQNPQSLFATATKGTTNVVGLVATGKPLAAFLVSPTPPDPNQKPIGRPTAIKTPCP
jgi:hypothetical protein